MVEESPEKGDKEIERKEAKDDSETFLRAEFSFEFFGIRLDVDEFFSAKPEKEGGHGHEDTGDSKREVRAVPLKNPWGGEHGEESPKIDGEVEPIEDLGEKVLVGFAELITDVG